MTFDPQGRILASDQGPAGLFRITPPPIGSSQPTRVERLDVQISSAQGLLFAFDSLYLTQKRRQERALPPARHQRRRPVRRGDQTQRYSGVGEHGPHALRLSPDGKQIYLVAGNHTLPPIEIKADPPQRLGGVRAGQRPRHAFAGQSQSAGPNWDEDLLLPRQWDSGGRAVGILAPAVGSPPPIPMAKNWEVRNIGFRNAYDLALNADGELFTYDADMEWDMGLPWYRPTRVLHAAAGGDFGWRSGTGVWPAYRIDCLPAAVNVGPGSPVGIEFGYGTKFPAEYQRALFALDWTYGAIYAIHLAADGASYTGTKEEFLSRSPLPLTDGAVGPDGAFYFITGGRSTQSELLSRHLCRHRIDGAGRRPRHPVCRAARTAPKDRGQLRSARRSGRRGNQARRAPLSLRPATFATRHAFRSNVCRPMSGKSECWPPTIPIA